MKVIIDIDEEDFRIMQHNVAVDNPLCPLGEKEIVTKIANGTPIFDNAISRDVFDKIEEERLLCNDIGFEAKFINAIPIPDEATNGEVIMAMFPNAEVEIDGKYITLWLDEYKCLETDYDLWNAPYQKGTEEDD